MKKYLFILISCLLVKFAFADSAEIMMTTLGQACKSAGSDLYESQDYLSSSADKSDYVFLEFNTSGLKNATILSATLSFVWAADASSDLGAVYIANASSASVLTGNAAIDANNGKISEGTVFDTIKSYTDDSTYTHDVTSQLKASQTSDYLGFALSGYFIPPFIYGYIEGESANAPRLTVSYSVGGIPEPSVGAISMAALALLLVAYRRR